MCTAAQCPHECEVVAQTLAELATMTCECGCALEIIGWPNRMDGGESALAVAA